MRKLKGGYGQDIESIGCDAIGGSDVIETNEDGGLVQTKTGIEFIINDKDEIIPHAPDGCPLLKAAELRVIGDFTVCASCPYSILDSDGMIEA